MSRRAIWSAALYTSPHAGRPIDSGMQPQRSSVWLRVQEGENVTWYDMTEHMRGVRALRQLVCEAVSSAPSVRGEVGDVDM